MAVIGAGEQERSPRRRAGTTGRRPRRKPSTRAKLIGRRTLPAIVTVIAIGIVLFLVSYVVPPGGRRLCGHKRALPALTVAMLAVSAASSPVRLGC